MCTIGLPAVSTTSGTAGQEHRSPGPRIRGLPAGSDVEEVDHSPIDQPAADPGRVPAAPVRARLAASRRAGHPLRSLKARAMLGYVALGAVAPRDAGAAGRTALERFERGPGAGGLRQVVRDLRDAPGGRGMFRSSLRPPRYRHRSRARPGRRVLEVLKAAESGEVHPLLLERRHLTDELLAGLEDVDPAFRVWLIAKRNTLRDRLLFALETAMAMPRPDRARKAGWRWRWSISIRRTRMLAGG